MTWVDGCFAAVMLRQERRVLAAPLGVVRIRHRHLSGASPTLTLDLQSISVTCTLVQKFKNSRPRQTLTKPSSGR